MGLSNGKSRPNGSRARIGRPPNADDSQLIALTLDLMHQHGEVPLIDEIIKAAGGAQKHRACRARKAALAAAAAMVADGESLRASTSRARVTQAANVADHANSPPEATVNLDGLVLETASLRNEVERLRAALDKAQREAATHAATARERKRTLELLLRQS